MINSSESSGIVELRLFFCPMRFFLCAEIPLTCVTTLLATRILALDVACIFVDSSPGPQIYLSDSVSGFWE